MKKCIQCNKEKLKKYFYKNYKMPDGLLRRCKECFDVRVINNYKNRPWILHYKYVKARCECITSGSYSRYGMKGIKFNMTVDEFKFLWFRDKAENLKVPSIDRINSKGNYEILNCRFIEKSLNSSLGARKKVFL